MGRFQRAGTDKNKKVTKISPLLAFWPVGLGIKLIIFELKTELKKTLMTSFTTLLTITFRIFHKVNKSQKFNQTLELHID